MTAALASLPAHATDIRTAAQENAEPRFVVSRDGGQTGIGGFCIDLMRTLERIDPRLHFSMSPQVQSLPRIRNRLAAGDLDAFCGLPRTPASESVLRFVEPPLYTARFHLAVRTDDQLMVQSWDEVRRLGKEGVILLATHSPIGQTLQERGGLKVDSSAADPGTNIRKLLAGRGRFFLHHVAGLRQAIRAARAEDKIRILPATMERQSLYLVLSDRVTAEIGNSIREALTRTVAGGELDGLLHKWEIE
jgi:hypothetical protein